jgi:hypothetical protein
MVRGRGLSQFRGSAAPGRRLCQPERRTFPPSGGAVFHAAGGPCQAERMLRHATSNSPPWKAALPFSGLECHPYRGQCLHGRQWPVITAPSGLPCDFSLIFPLCVKCHSRVSQGSWPIEGSGSCATA